VSARRRAASSRRHSGRGRRRCRASSSCAITSHVIAGANATRHLEDNQEIAMTDIAAFVDRYVNIWNEPDPQRRRETVRELWQEDARHLARTIEAAGHDGIEIRVANA